MVDKVKPIEKPVSTDLDTTSRWIIGGSAALSAAMSGYKYATGKESDLPGVSGQAQVGVARSDALASRLTSEQGLSDTSYGRAERSINTQASELISNISAQARDTLQASPLMFDKLVNEAVEKSASMSQTGLEKLQEMDINVALQNAQAGIQASAHAANLALQVDERDREIEDQRREIDAQRNLVFSNAIKQLAKSMGIATEGIGGGDKEDVIAPEDKFITEDLVSEIDDPEAARDRMLATEANIQTPEQREAILAENARLDAQDEAESDVDRIIRDADEAENVRLGIDGLSDVDKERVKKGELPENIKLSRSEYDILQGTLKDLGY